MHKLFINTDGGSRGNPGPAGIGVAFSDEKGQIVYSYKKFIGFATNNEAEYAAIIEALRIFLKSTWYKENNGSGGEVVCRLDSQLVVEQILGNYKIKQPHLIDLVSELKKLIDQIDLKLSFVHVPREENKVADKLVNEALDEAKASS